MCKQRGIDVSEFQGVAIKATRYGYSIDVRKEREGSWSVTFPEFDEAFTDGDTFAEAVMEAADCLE